MYNSPSNYQTQAYAATTYPTTLTYPPTVAYPSTQTPSTPTAAENQPARQQQSYSPSPAPQPYQTQQTYQPIATYSQTYQPVITYTPQTSDVNAPHLHNQQSSVGTASYGHPVYNDHTHHYNQVDNVQNQAYQPSAASQNGYPATYQANNIANAYGGAQTHSNQDYSQATSQDAISNSVHA